MYWLEDHQVANNIGPLDAGYAIFPQVNQRSFGRIQVQYTWADHPDVAFIPARLRRVEVFCEFYYNWIPVSSGLFPKDTEDVQE